MYQLASDRHRQRPAAAETQRPPGARSHWPGPPAAPSTPNARCAAPPARPGGCAPSSTPRPPAISDCPPATAGNPAPATTNRRSP